MDIESALKVLDGYIEDLEENGEAVDFAMANSLAELKSDLDGAAGPTGAAELVRICSNELFEITPEDGDTNYVDELEAQVLRTCAWHRSLLR